MKPNSAGPLDICRNGDCKRPATHGRHRWCLRCWAGMKWTSINQRVRNKNGNNPSYQGVPVGFTRPEFIAWVMGNPPPAGLREPSIDRIVPERGYAPGNLRWLEKRQNSRHKLADLPLTHQHCAMCKQILPATDEHFSPAGRKLSAYCRPCKRKYQAVWRGRNRERIRARALELSRQPHRIAARAAHYLRTKEARNGN